MKSSRPTVAENEVAGEADRLEELYVRHAGGGIRLAYLLTGDRPLAEDLVQDAFVRVAGRLVHLRNPDAFEAYLRRTVVNLARMHFRRRRMERTRAERVASIRPRSHDQPDVAEQDRMRRALLRIPVRQRSALVLRFYEDLSDVQTAEMMRCRPGTVRSLVSRGMESMRSAMEDESDG